MKVAFIAENLRTRLPGVVKGAFDAESLIGRQRQRECLRAWVNELTKGRGRAVLVEGEPGTASVWSSIRSLPREIPLRRGAG